MTPEEAEAIYDGEIAPALLKIVERCKDLGFSMVAHVEFSPGESGITQHVPDSAAAQMHMTQLAAHSNGNFDKLAIDVMRKWPDATERCIVLQHLRSTRE